METLGGHREQPNITLPVGNVFMRSMTIWAALAILLLAFGCAPLLHGHSAQEYQKYENAKMLFDKGSYREARGAYLDLAEAYPQSPRTEKALFNASYILVYYKNPDKDYDKARHEFEEFLKRYPKSELAGEAQSWVGLVKAYDQSQVHELLAEVEALTRKADETAKELRSDAAEKERLVKERDLLLIDRSNLARKVDELLNDKNGLLNEKESLLRDREQLMTDKAELEKKNQILASEKEELLQAKAKLEKSVRDLTMVDVKMEKQRKKMKKKEIESGRKAASSTKEAQGK